MKRTINALVFAAILIAVLVFTTIEWYSHCISIKCIAMAYIAYISMIGAIWYTIDAALRGD